MGLFWKSEIGDAQFEELDKISYERAKKLSDFIGMIVRLGFLGVCVFILWDRASTTSLVFLRILYYSSLSLFSILMFMMIGNINSIFMGFFLREVRMLPNKFLRKLAHAIAFLLSMVFYYGYSEVALQIARKGTE